MSIKELLAKDKPLFESANAVVKTEWFARYLAMCRAEFMTQSDTNKDILKGALKYEEVVLGMTDLPEDSRGLPGAGIIHDIDAYLAKEKEQEQKKD